MSITGALQLCKNPLAAPKVASLRDSTPLKSPESWCLHARLARPSAHSFCLEFAPRESHAPQIFGLRRLLRSRTPFDPPSVSPHLSHPHQAAPAVRNRQPS